jgi:CubicO group peptidase (beta-lactamase class C family)
MLTSGRRRAVFTGIPARWVWLLIVASLAFAIRATAQNAADVSTRKDYAAVADALRPFIQREMAEKQLPGLSIAIVDDQQIVWSKSQKARHPRNRISDRLGFKTFHGHWNYAAGRARQTQFGCSDHRLSP